MFEKIGVFKDYDGTIKTVCKENDNYIEMTLLTNRDNTDVVCVPTHNYCNLGCTMCHLCNKKLNKEMMPVKDDDFFKALYYSITNKDMNRRTNNEKILLSFMGVGEPMLNLDLLFDIFMQTLKIKSFNYDEVGFAISTMMPNDNILKLANFVDKNNIPVKVHFSLHAPIDDIRKTLIPGAKFSVDECIKLLVEYKNIVTKNEILCKNIGNCHKSNNFVELHYTLIDGVNDSDECLWKLIEISSKNSLPVKLIRFNPKDDLKRSEKEDLFLQNLLDAGVEAKIYAPPGKNIGSSCGEFTRHYYHELIETEEQLQEFLEWKRKFEIFD